MKLVSESFVSGDPLPEALAFAEAHPEDKTQLAGNRNPHLSWRDLPEGTKSLALIVHDPDVPSVPDDINQEGKGISRDLERIDFYHWVLVDLDPESGAIAEGELSDGVTPGGKPGPDCPRGRQGVNNYGMFFEAMGDASMAGTYFGYDGPCPPWNDSIVHHYVFTLYALDLERCPVEGEFGGQDVLDAIEDHVLDRAALMGTYTINPGAVDLRA